MAKDSQKLKRKGREGLLFLNQPLFVLQRSIVWKQGMRPGSPA
jgi:hypothetical protein